MPKIEPINDATLNKLLGTALFGEWQSLTKLITSAYEMDEEWHSAAKGEKYELKFRRGGKTLVSLFPTYPKEDGIGVMIIFGKQEREKFEAQKAAFSPLTNSYYTNAPTFHDGKWIMFEAPSDELTKDLLALLAIKRKPNRKS